MAPSKSRIIKKKKLALVEGAKVMYNGISPAIILKVHHDDGAEKYYTIQMQEDGRERQTDSTHLILCN